MISLTSVVLGLATLLTGGLHGAYYLYNAVIAKPKEFNKPNPKNKDKYSVEVITCIKNEERFIEQKIRNCKSLKYPKIKFTFVYDTSNDRTLELLRKNKNDKINLVVNKTLLGKHISLLNAVKKSKADVLVFTDANVFLNEDAIEKIVSHLDENVVGVCGNVTVVKDDKMMGAFGLYWNFEKKIKAAQASTGNLVGFNGAFYAIKREYYKLNEENQLNDFEIAFAIQKQGKKTTFAKDALAMEIENRNFFSAFMARIRVANMTFVAFKRIAKQFSSLDRGFQYHFFMHKRLRYVFMIFATLLLPLAIYELAKISPWLLLIFVLPPVFRIIQEFIAVFAGWILALSGKEYKTWTNKK